MLVFNDKLGLTLVTLEGQEKFEFKLAFMGSKVYS